jgi:hypothetical protein
MKLDMLCSWIKNEIEIKKHSVAIDGTFENCWINKDYTILQSPITGCPVYMERPKECGRH